MTTIDYGTVIPIPRSIAVCPYCKGDLVAQPTGWMESDNPTDRANDLWLVSESGLECTKEPDLDESDPEVGEQLEKYDDWLNEHTYMPYVYWLPVDLKVREWLNQHFRWKDKKREEAIA